MKAFTDSAGKTWTVCMTIDSVKRVRDLLNVNLVEPEAGDPPLLTRLGTDEILLCDVVFCLIKPQADVLGVTDEDFAVPWAAMRSSQLKQPYMRSSSIFS